MYIYIYRERERDRERENLDIDERWIDIKLNNKNLTNNYVHRCLSIFMSIYLTYSIFLQISCLFYSSPKVPSLFLILYICLILGVYVNHHSITTENKNYNFTAQNSFITSAPIGALKSNALAYRKLWQTNQPAIQQYDQPTKGQEGFYGSYTSIDVLKA